VNTKQKINDIIIGSLPENKTVCLTLDLEQDYGDLLKIPEYQGLKYIPDLASFIRQSNISLTVFVQGSIFEMFPDVIGQLSELDVEFELHSYSHRRYQNTNTKYEVESGKSAYYKYFGRNPKGYRFPSGIFNASDYKTLVDNGFQFDSSVFPSVRPGAFNNLNKPITPYYLNDPGIIEFPFTVFSRFLRIPIALSYIRLLGWPYLELIKSPILPKFIILNFHMHDLFTLPTASKINAQESSLLSKYIYKRIYLQEKSNGYSLLKIIVAMLKKRKFTFAKLETIYPLIINNIK
jgi:peptidoglycan/xylan/chitin deacetylase (PgdA/CDA1 family)